MKRVLRSLLILTMGGTLLLSGCGGGEVTPTVSAPASNYKVGKPYQVKGVWYYPQEDFNYEETGIASWYGPNFHGKLTANGEVFDQNSLTAAHKTLQMPAVARVTNLENGRSIVVRINDRGPFAHTRIIDLSRRSAQLLGMEAKGTAKVRVKILPDESRALAGKAAVGQSTLVTAAPVEASPRASVQGESLSGEKDTVVARHSAVETMQEEQERLARKTEDDLAKQDVWQESVKEATALYIQTGSFSRRDNALRMQKTLDRFGKSRLAQAKGKDGQTVWRVQLGPLGSLDVADKTLESVIGSGMQDAKIVVD